MPEALSSLTHHQLTQLSQPIQTLLSSTPYTPPNHTNISLKSHLLSLLTPETTLTNFTLCCAFLASSTSQTPSKSQFTIWVPDNLAAAAVSALGQLSELVYGGSGWVERRLVVDLVPKVVPLIKDRIKESSIGGGEGEDEFSAASARTPLEYAVVAAYQLRWIVSQVERPKLGELCDWVVPCGLTALDHWSTEVKEQGMITFIHLAKNVNATELGCYGDVILDACSHNIVSSDELWHLAVEMSVLLLTCLQRNNPRSPWFEKMLNEMFGHLERQPRNKERRIVWLKHIDPLFCSVGLVLLAHFRRLFPLFFHWMHADDDETILLVLKRIITVVKLTWIRNSPHFVRLVDELTVLYKEASMKIAREEIRTCICQILSLLKQCKGLQFETTWEKYKDDANLEALAQSVAGNATTVVH